MLRYIKKHPYLFGFILFSLVCAFGLLICRLSPNFAEWFATGPAALFRYLIAGLTAPLFFSLFEVSIALFCLFTIFVLILGVYTLVGKLKKKGSAKAFFKCLTALCLTLLVVGDLFCLTFAPCYFRKSTAHHMNLHTDSVDASAVFAAMEALCGIVNESAPHLKLNQNKESEAELSLSDTAKSVVEAADRFAQKHSFYQKKGFPTKTFLSSPLMTYTHISGVYGFFTGEANVNTNYPHFVVSATMAHETCHARGIAPENECNFLAAVILMESESAYLRYCGAAFLLDDFITVCKKIDAERTNELLSQTDPVLLRDYAAYNRFFEPYRDSTASKVADKTNSTYLKAMGQSDGTISYSRIIALTSAYFLQNTP